MNLSDAKVLVVDDDRDIIEFLSYNLKKSGFNLHVAYNGKDAINLVQRI